jgi:hypothetical protein
MALPSLCAYPGCRNSFRGNDLPTDWNWMLLYWSRRPSADQTVADVAFSASCLRDTCLCPKHSKMFELPRADPEFLSNPQGRA